MSKMSSLLDSESFLSSKKIKKTEKSLYFVEFLINNLVSNKAQGHDEISIRKLKICGSSVC